MEYMREDGVQNIGCGVLVATVELDSLPLIGKNRAPSYTMNSIDIESRENADVKG